MRIAIVGAGAIGCMLAAGLSEHGHELTLVGRPEQVEAIQRDGLLVTGPRATTRRYHLDALTQLAARPDLVLLTVKSPDVAAACAQILPVAAGVPVVAMQNGLRGDTLAADVLGRDAVMGAVVMCAASYLKPGEVTVQFPGWLIVGEPFGPLRPRTPAIAAALGDAVPTYVTRHLVRTRMSKLIFNLNNALCAVTGLTLPELARTSIGRVASVRLMKEGCHVARAAGIPLDHALYGLNSQALRRAPDAALLSLLQGLMSTALAALPEPAALALAGAASRGRLGRLPLRFSLWQSITRGRPSEIEYLNGEVVQLGARLGVPTPYNAHLVALVHEVERTHAFCGVEALRPPGALPAARPTMTAGIQ